MDRIFVVIIGIPLGFIVMIYRYNLKQLFGSIPWAEQHMGSGGTYNFFILLGLLISIISLMYGLGTIQSLLGSFLGPLFGVDSV